MKQEIPQFRHKRVPTDLPVALCYPGSPSAFNLNSENISLSGVFLNTSLDFGVGDLLACAFKLPGSKKALALTSMVCRKVSPSRRKDTHPGIGLKFLDLDSPERQHLMQYVHSMEVSDDSEESTFFTEAP